MSERTSGTPSANGEYLFYLPADRPTLFYLTFTLTLTALATLGALGLPLLLGAGVMFLLEGDIKTAGSTLFGTLCGGMGIAFVLAMLWPASREGLLRRRFPEKYFIAITSHSFIYRWGDDLTIIPLERIMDIEEHFKTYPSEGEGWDWFVRVRYRSPSGTEENLDIERIDFTPPEHEHLGEVLAAALHRIRGY